MREATGALFDRIDGSKWSTGAASESDRCGAGYTIPPLVWYIFGVSETCHPVTTKRLVIGQVSVCIGCCCGQTDRGKPAVPVEWLKTEWRQRGLLKNIQLTISGCLGPCDVPNVVLISTAKECVWLGNIDSFEYYREIVEWAAESKAAGRMLPLSQGLLRHRLDPFR